jgi:Uri superfamily endonuclease
VEITQKADFRLRNIVNFYIGSGFREVHYYTKSSIKKRIQEHSRNNPKFVYHVFVDGIEEVIQNSQTPVNMVTETHHDVNQILNNKQDEFLERIMSNLKTNKD